MILRLLHFGISKYYARLKCIQYTSRERMAAIASLGMQCMQSSTKTFFWLGSQCSGGAYWGSSVERHSVIFGIPMGNVARWCSHSRCWSVLAETAATGHASTRRPPTAYSAPHQSTKSKFKEIHRVNCYWTHE